MAATKAEGLQWVMTVMNTIHSIFDTVGGIHEKLPETWKQRLPGFLGLSLADEQIFNGVISQLDAKKQTVIMRFLREKCKDHERNRFINIVAGMEVAPGSPEEIEKKWNNKARGFEEKKKTSKPAIDRRFNFLDKFADIITTEFNGDLVKAYDFCIGGRMIIPDPIHEKVTVPVKDTIRKAKQKLSENSADLNSSAQSFEDKAKAFYVRSKRRR